MATAYESVIKSTGVQSGNTFKLVKEINTSNGNNNNNNNSDGKNVSSLHFKGGLFLSNKVMSRNNNDSNNISKQEDALVSSASSPLPAKNKFAKSIVLAKIPDNTRNLNFQNNSFSSTSTATSLVTESPISPQTSTSANNTSPNLNDINKVKSKLSFNKSIDEDNIVEGSPKIGVVGNANNNIASSADKIKNKGSFKMDDLELKDVDTKSNSEDTDSSLIKKKSSNISSSVNNDK